MRIADRQDILHSSYTISITNTPLHAIIDQHDTIHGTFTWNGPDPLPVVETGREPVSLGFRMYTRAMTQIVKEERLPLPEKTLEAGTPIPFEIPFRAIVLTPGVYTLQFDLIIEQRFWFDVQPLRIPIVMETAPDFVDVYELMETYSVEELCGTAEEYYASRRDALRFHIKPYTLEHIPQAYPTFTAMLGGMQLEKGMSVLDFGCGSGWASRALNQLNLEVYSLDASKTALEITREIAEATPLYQTLPPHHYLHFDGRTIDLSDASVDRIFCMDVFHHIVNQEEILAEMARVLKPGGIAAFAEPGPRHSFSERSQQEMRNFKVVERDIVVEEVFALAQECGFTEMTFALTPLIPQYISYEAYQNFPQQQEVVERYLQATKARIENNPFFFLHKG